MIKTVPPEEINLFYSQGEEVDCKTGIVGHLRGDFGSGGNEFWTTWWDHQGELNNQEFKNDIGSAIKKMREDGLLNNLAAMRSFCYGAHGAEIPSSMGDCYGFRHDSDDYSYYIRASTKQGDYNFYVYCYQRETLEQYLENMKQEQIPADENAQQGGIRFC